ncbi:MAG: methyltransferase domain-containing protein [Rhodospirillaceae bacterium]|nr:methyltransferase domain-containing protein [Rhodospirillaceae bacterium]
MTLRKLSLLCAVAAFVMNSAAVGSLSAQAAPAAEKAGAAKAPFTPQSGQAGKDVVWVPTPQALVDRMLDMAQLAKQDYLIDLGSGDGRTVITAAKRGTRALGIEYNPDMVTLAKSNAETEGVSGLATFERADIFQSDFSKASVITLFLLPELNIRLRPILLNMKPDTRVVSNTFNMGDWMPDETIDAGGDCTSWCTAYKWIVPAKVSGDWQMAGGGQLKLTQTYQALDGMLTMAGKPMPIANAKMNGTEIAFVVTGKRYTGRVEGSTMKGSIEGGGSWSATRGQ